MLHVILAQSSNVVTDPSGVDWSATSNAGYFWAGFGFGLVVYCFGLIMRMGRKTAGVSDF